MPTDPIAGHKIVSVRAISKAELAAAHGGLAVVIVLDDGTILYTSLPVVLPELDDAG